MNTDAFGRQLFTYWTIAAYVRVHGYPPTIEELAKQRNLGVKAIYVHLRQLEALGYLTRGKGWRNIRLNEVAA